MSQFFTKEGLEKIKKELEKLKTVEIKNVTKLIKEAAAFGDLKENAAYHEARNTKSFLLGRIEQLEIAVNEAVIVEKKSGGEIQIGSEISILFDGKKENYKIVSPAIANVLENKISYESPLGKHLMGKKLKDEFNYEISGKKIKVKVLEIK